MTRIVRFHRNVRRRNTHETVKTLMPMRTVRAVYMAVLLTALLAGANRVLAHHAFSSEFDANKKVTMTGTVSKMEWVNPHAWLWIEVKGADGKVEEWGFEFGPPNALFRRGWRMSSVPIGGEVTVTCFLAKGGRKVGSAAQVKLPDGRTLFAGTEGNGAPTDKTDER
jgi:hypothetical protein